jgi:hypothetical protein
MNTKLLDAVLYIAALLFLVYALGTTAAAIFLVLLTLLVINYVD